MRLGSAIFVLVVGLAFLVSGCFYDPDRSKISEEDTSEEDSVSDGGITDAGIGSECTEDKPCTDEEADFCLTSPMAPGEPGICTVKDCAPGDCPAGYKCCNCTGSSVMDVVACIPEDDVAFFEDYCTCS